MFTEELPLSVHEELDRRGLNGVPVVLCASSELSLSGEPARNWIVATKDNITAGRETTCRDASLCETHAPLAEREDHTAVVETLTPVSEVLEFRAQGAGGSGF